jgi:glycosyltransferase involved in cell wall biosynthesis
MVLNAPYPSDLRVGKEAGSLIKSGFDVYLLCLRSHEQRETETVDGIKVIRIDAGVSKAALAFWDVIMSLFFIHPIFKKAIRTTLCNESIKLVHVHDLPLAGTALALKKELGLTVIVDLHENYPEAMSLWFGWKKNIIVRLKNYLFMNEKRWARWEKKATSECDKIISVVDEQKAFILGKYPSLAAEKIVVVSNTELRSFCNQPVDPSVYKNYQGKFIICYTGGLGAVRGVDIVVKGMAFLKSYPNIVFVIVGSGSPDFLDTLNRIIRTSGVESAVHLLGHQPFSKVYSFMKLADINVVPHLKNSQSEYGVPHKLFQNMMAGKPVIVSNCGPIQRIIESSSAGLAFEAGDPESFSKAVLTIYNDAVFAQKMGKNGIHETLDGKLNWETTALELIRLYNTI